MKKKNLFLKKSFRIVKKKYLFYGRFTYGSHQNRLLSSSINISLISVKTQK